MEERSAKRDDGMNRRQFLRNSAYAAYATPVVLTMLVDKASAAKSWTPGNGGYNCKDGHSGDRRYTRRKRKAIRRLKNANRRNRRRDRNPA